MKAINVIAALWFLAIVVFFIVTVRIDQRYQQIEKSECKCSKPGTLYLQAEGCTLRLLIKRLDSSTVWMDTKEECHD